MATSTYSYLDDAKKQLADPASPYPGPQQAGTDPNMKYALGSPAPQQVPDGEAPAATPAPAKTDAPPATTPPSQPASTPPPGAVPPPPPPPPPTPTAPPGALGGMASLQVYGGDKANADAPDPYRAGDTTQHWAGGGGPQYSEGVSAEEAAAWNFKEGRPKTAAELAAEKNTTTKTETKTPPTVTPPSTNSADYHATQTAAGDYLGGWNETFKNWLMQQMNNPSPYGTDLIKQGQAVLDDGIKRQWATGQKQVEEYFASRGMTGSSLEAEAMKDLRAQMEEQYRKGSFDLGQAQVAAYQQQTSTVGNLGLGFGNNLTSQQQNALADIHAQMSMALQKYGIDKASADAEASRQLEKEMQDAGFEHSDNQFKKQAILDYGGNATGEQWDQYAAAYGKDAAQQDLGFRPADKTATPPATPAGTPPAPTPSLAPQGGITPQRVDHGIALTTQEKTEAEAAAATLRQTVMSLATRQSVWDAFAAKYGTSHAQQALGQRPTS